MPAWIVEVKAVLSANGPEQKRAQIEELKRWLQDNPDSARYVDLAELQIEMGELHDAESVLRAGIKRGVVEVAARRVLSRLLLLPDRDPFARETLQETPSRREIEDTAHTQIGPERSRKTEPISASSEERRSRSTEVVETSEDEERRSKTAVHQDSDEGQETTRLSSTINQPRDAGDDTQSKLSGPESVDENYEPSQKPSALSGLFNFEAPDETLDGETGERRSEPPAMNDHDDVPLTDAMSARARSHTDIIENEPPVAQVEDKPAQILSRPTLDEGELAEPRTVKSAVKSDELNVFEESEKSISTDSLDESRGTVRRPRPELGPLRVPYGGADAMNEAPQIADANTEQSVFDSNELKGGKGASPAVAPELAARSELDEVPTGRHRVSGERARTQKQQRTKKGRERAALNTRESESGEQRRQDLTFPSVERGSSSIIPEAHRPQHSPPVGSPTDSREAQRRIALSAEEERQPRLRSLIPPPLPSESAESPAPASPHARPTELAQPLNERTDQERLRLSFMIVGVSALVILLLICVVASARYAADTDELIQFNERHKSLLQDGNYVSRRNLEQARQRQAAKSDGWSQLARGMVRLVAVPKMDVANAQRRALFLRNTFELAYLYADSGDLDEARRRLEAEVMIENSSDDLAIAQVLAALSNYDFQRAKRLATTYEYRDEAEGNWIKSVVARAMGETQTALELARASTRINSAHPHAYPLLVELRSELAPPLDALESYNRLLVQTKPGHLGSMIGLERLRLKTRKRAGEAVTNLRSLLRKKRSQVSPREEALIHDGLGRFALINGQLDVARSAMAAATAAAPGRVEFVRPMVAFHLLQLELKEAAALLSKLPGKAQVAMTSSRARLSLLRGQPNRAIQHLEEGQSTHGEDRLSRLMMIAWARLHHARDRGDADEASLRQALVHLREAKRLSPKSAEVDAMTLWAKAVLEPKNERHVEALKKLRLRAQEASEHRVDRTLIWRAYGEVLMSRGRYRQAASSFRVALKVEPLDFWARWGLCRAYSKRLKTRDAIEACRAVVQNPAFQPAVERLVSLAESYGDHGAVVDALSPRFIAGRLSPPDFRRLARAQLGLGQLAKVESMIDDPRWASEEQSIQYARGIVALHRGDLSLAQRILESVALSLPNDAPVQRSYARSLIEGDRSAESTELLRSSSAKNQSALTSLLLAKALVKVGRWDDATRAAMSARAQAAKTHTHPRVRAEALAIDAQSRVLAGRRADREIAARNIRQALAIEPDLPDGLLAKGLLEESGRRPSKAVPTYRRLVQVQPQSAQGYFRLGRLLSRKARTRGAGRRALATALRLDPDGIWGTRASRVLGR